MNETTAYFGAAPEIQQKTQNLIFNFSSRQLSQKEVELLNLGLNFVPTPSYRSFKTRVDIYKLIRLLKLRVFFKDSNVYKEDVFSPHSTFCPNIEDPAITVFNRLILKDIHNLEMSKRKWYYNLSKNDFDILENLGKDNDLVFKQADKGGGIVLLDKQQYINEVNRQLSDSFFYKTLSTNPTPHITSIIRTVLNEGLSLNYIQEKTFKFLCNQHPRVPIFHVLPKVHKVKNPGDLPPGRPIISGVNSLLEPLAKYIDFHIKSFTKDTPSYIRDSADFITQLEGLKIPEGAGLLTMDVNALYTNIPIDEARTVVEQTLSLRTQPFPPSHFLLDLLDICLENNFFRFKEQFFLQIRGVAMGSPIAPSIANLYMIQFEKCIILDPMYNPFFII